MRRTGLLALGVVAASLAGCGGGGSSGAQPAPSASATPAATASAESTTSASPDSHQHAEALRMARAALLTLDDLPKGWKTAASSGSAKSKGFDTGLARCLHVSPSVLGVPAKDGVAVNTPEFSPPTDRQASATESISIQPAATIDAAFAAVTSSRLPQCFDSLAAPYFKKVLAGTPNSRAKFGTVSSAALSFPSLGDASAAFGFSIPVSEDGQTVRIFDNLVFVRHGNAIAILAFEDAPAEFDKDTALVIAQKAAAKLSAIDS